MEPVLQVRNLTKRYRNGRGIRDVSFAMERGDILGFFGPNGAGKTTVLKILTGLLRADEGHVRLFGHDVALRPDLALAKVGSIVETAEAYGYMSARQNLLLAARFYKNLPHARIDEVLEKVGLASYGGEKVRGFSLGMKQRLALAMALVSGPELIILDEPTNGLDIEGMVDTRRLIQQLAEEEQVSFLISSHMIQEMEQMCSRVAILHGGELIAEGEVAGILQNQSLEQYYLTAVEAARRDVRHA